ncbi:MAG: class I SAM-dependent methyltransferase [Candidatus Nanopelagicales bacterium]
MSDGARADVVAQQYKKWQYPEPIQNLETWMANNWEWFDPSHAHRILWPDRPFQSDLDILSAGCGTNQAPVVAYANRASKVTAIDVSQESLDHGKYLKDKYGLKNLELHLLPIEEVASLNQDFDLILCTGVLHHMASPQTGMNALSGVLRPEGVAAIMLYARYGRIGVEIMQSVFRELGLHQDEESLRIVRTGLNSLDPSHPARTYLSVATDVGYDAGMVDTFLHGRDVSFTVQDCLDLVENSGLVFQDWYLKTPVYPPTLVDPENEFYSAIAGLPERQMWAVMERLRNLNGCHFFTACKPERPASHYRIDFSAGNALDYVPLWRLNAGIDGASAFRPGWTIQLDPTHLAFSQHVDGDRTIREIAARVGQSGVIGRADQAELELIALELFEQLWRMDFLAIDLTGTAARA